MQEPKLPDLNTLQIENDRFAHITDALARLQNGQAHIKATVMTGEVPNGVQKFTADVRTEFAKTVTNLRATAANLVEVARDLEQRANDIEGCTTTLTDEIMRWISYERDSSRLQKFYAGLFEKRDA